MGSGLININGDNVQVLEILFLTTMITLLRSEEHTSELQSPS